MIINKSKPQQVLLQTSFEREVEAYHSKSKLSSYDTLATPVDNNAYKTAANNATVTINNPLENSESKRAAQSKILQRAARSITKTKSVSGNFIVKTTVMKTPAKNQVKFDAENEANVEIRSPNRDQVAKPTPNKLTSVASMSPTSGEKDAH